MATARRWPCRPSFELAALVLTMRTADQQRCDCHQCEDFCIVSLSLVLSAGSRQRMLARVRRGSCKGGVTKGG